MSARSAQRWRRWRMGRDKAGRKDRDGRLSGLAGTCCREWRRGSASSFFISLALTHMSNLKLIGYSCMHYLIINSRFGSRLLAASLPQGFRLRAAAFELTSWRGFTPRRPRQPCWHTHITYKTVNAIYIRIYLISVSLTFAVIMLFCAYSW